MWQSAAILKDLSTKITPDMVKKVRLFHTHNTHTHTHTHISSNSAPCALSPTVWLCPTFLKRPRLAVQVKDVFAFEIDGKAYTLDLKKEGKLHEGKVKGMKPCCTMLMSEAVFVDLFTGKMNAQKGFMQGKYKIKGNIMASQKLQALMGK